jgi:hypothetical protein
MLLFLSVSLCSISCNTFKQDISNLNNFSNEPVLPTETNNPVQMEEDLTSDDIEDNSQTNEKQTTSVDSDLDANTDSGENGQIIELYNYRDIIDVKNEEDLLSSMRTVINDSSEEEAFAARFIDDLETATITDNSVIKIVREEFDENCSIVFFIKNENFDYPEIAYGIRFDEKKAKEEALLTIDEDKDVFDRICALDGAEYDLIDFLKPLTDYQDITYYRSEENKLIKAEYASDDQIYGTYNSTGVLYYDENERAILREYYTTSGNRFLSYIYDDEKLTMICEFGGRAYKGLDDSSETEIGMDFMVYILP